jgi:lipopolysaccharide export system permease protein
MFLGTLVGYSRMATDSEMVVFRSAGMSRLKLIKPAILFALFITFLSYFISLYLLPTSYRVFKDTESFVRDKHGAALLQEGVFNSLSKGFTFYFRERDDEGNFRGILIHDNTKEGKAITFMAQTGYPIAGPTGEPRLMTYNGNAQEVNLNSNELLQTEFDSHVVDLKFFTKSFNKKRWREPEERYLRELFYPTDTEDRFLQKLYAEGHQRIVWPLYNLLLTIIALYAYTTGDFNRRGQMKKTITCVVSAISFFIVGLVLKFLTAGNPAFTSLMYAVILMAIALSFFLLVRERTNHIPKKLNIPVARR